MNGSSEGNSIIIIYAFMRREIFFIGYTEEEVKRFLEDIIKGCLKEYNLQIGGGEQKLTIRQACKMLGVSAPTLRKFVREKLIRRHDVGARKMYFYLSELNEDIKALSLIRK